MTEEHDPLREDERRVTAVLHALTHVAPDDAMQARLVASLRTTAVANIAQDATARPRWLPLFTFGSSPAWLALTAGLLAVAGICLHQTPRRSFQPEFATAGTYPAAESERARTRPAMTAEATPIAPPFQQKGASASIVTHGSEPSATRTLLPSSPTATISLEGSRPHTQGADDASILPPPLPLTEQERLLLRLGHRQPAEQLALMTLPARNAAYQQEKDAVAEFFAPAPPLRSQAEAAPPDEPAGQP